jgi:hypothetical protein
LFLVSWRFHLRPPNVPAVHRREPHAKKYSAREIAEAVRVRCNRELDRGSRPVKKHRGVATSDDI